MNFLVHSLYLPLEVLVVALLLQPHLQGLDRLGRVLGLLPQPTDLVLALFAQAAEGVVQLLDLAVEGGHVAAAAAVVLQGPGLEYKRMF